MLHVCHSCFMLCHLCFSPSSSSCKESIKNKPKQNIKIKMIRKYSLQGRCSCIGILNKITSCVSFQELDVILYD